ncbi:MAG TPA: nicotinate-nucleotide adenylyltransferase [Parvularculaceae bacterium]|nr:nicotinate-nucleotide adenylyltransferase [Parvularculaceae bacterium]
MDAVIPQRHDASRIGLLGGSFNPAHGGHREISLEALKLFGLDAVWWLVTPGNPLKTGDDYKYDSYEQRLAAARRIADHPRIVVSNFEDRKNLQYTVDTLEALHDLWPQMKFIWLMGADSLVGFHRWKNWRRIASLAPIAVFNRPGFEAAALASDAAKELTLFRLPSSRASDLAAAEPPAWVFIEKTANPLSATEIRMARKTEKPR